MSFVVGSRNDEHGGDPRRRTEIFVHGLAALCARHGLDAELVMVEWNTPADRPPLAAALRWPPASGRLAIRVVTVPPRLHATVHNAARVPFFQYLAKNVGIRRARGAFVVATNIDLLFSPALIDFLATGPLDADCVYRLDRLDVGLRDLPAGCDVDEQLALCSLHVARVCAAAGTVEPPRRTLRARYGHAAGAAPVPSAAERAALLARAERAAPHFEASGDFTMLAREAWERLGGYPELPLHSMHQDSIFLKLALLAGLRQIVLPDPMRMYHLEHGAGWGVVQDRARILASYPQLTDEQAARFLARLDAIGPAASPNAADWGLAAEELAEWRCEPAARAGEAVA